MSSLDSLNVLVKASSKETVEKIINLIFITRNTSKEQCMEAIVSLLELDDEMEARMLIDSVLQCIESCLLSGDINDLALLLKSQEATNVHSKLKSLLGQIISEKLDTWRESSALGRVSLPQLIGFDWALHFQKASNEINSMQKPSVIIELNVQDQPISTTQMPDNKRVDFEVNREALETMIDGLGKIRDQLSKMG